MHICKPDSRNRPFLFNFVWVSTLSTSHNSFSETCKPGHSDTHE